MVRWKVETAQGRKVDSRVKSWNGQSGRTKVKLSQKGRLVSVSGWDLSQQCKRAVRRNAGTVTGGKNTDLANRWFE